MQKGKKLRQTEKTVYDYKSIDTENFIKFIKDYDYQHILDSDVGKQPLLLTNILKATFDKFVPKKEIVFRPNLPPWSNPFTRLLLRKKNRNY